MLAFALPSRATQKPLWELGLGVGAISFAEYRGAGSSQIFPVPVPYIIYRGRYLQADRDGVRGILLRDQRFELNLSVSATTPVDSDGNAARRGMPDLRSALEAGPSVDLHLWRDDSRAFTLDLRVPLRAAYTLEANPRMIGWLLSPRLNLDIRNPAGPAGWKLGVLAGPLFADRRYNAYFYSVEPQFALAQRPAYHARGGYAGSQLLVSVSRRFERTWIGAFARYDRLDGAVFADSPLVRSRSAWFAGFGIAWIFRESATLVEVPD